jgi:hypothetical protein
VARTTFDVIPVCRQSVSLVSALEADGGYRLCRRGLLLSRGTQV